MATIGRDDPLANHPANDSDGKVRAGAACISKRPSLHAMTQNVAQPAHKLNFVSGRPALARPKPAAVLS